MGRPVLAAVGIAVLVLLAFEYGETGGNNPGGEVVHVGDGDSLRVRMADGALVEVRLAQIDAPELHQPYGRRARSALADRTLGRRVDLEVVDQDPYGRLVAELYVDDVHVNALLVREGHAWANTRWLRGPEAEALEREAREARRGLWALPDAERSPPWEWRREHGTRNGGRRGGR